MIVALGNGGDDFNNELVRSSGKHFQFIATLELLTKTKEFPHVEERLYFQTALPFPQHFVCTYKYCELKDYMKSIFDILDPCEMQRVILTGPKGEGKSLSLLALAVEMNKTMIWSSIYDERILNDYIGKKLTKALLLKKKVLLFLDFGRGIKPDSKR